MEFAESNIPEDARIDSPIEFFTVDQIHMAYFRAIVMVRKLRDELKLQTEDRSKLFQRASNSAYDLSELKKQHQVELASAHAELSKIRDQAKVLEQKIVSAQNDCMSLRKSNAILKGLAKRKGK